MKFVASVLMPMPCPQNISAGSAAVKEGWLNPSPGSIIKGLSQSRKYCIFLDSGFLLIFRGGPPNLCGFEEVVAIRDADRIEAVEPGAEPRNVRTDSISQTNSNVSGVASAALASFLSEDDSDTFGFHIVFDNLALWEKKVVEAEEEYTASVESAQKVKQRLAKLEKHSDKIKAALAKKETLSERKREKVEKAYSSYVKKLSLLNQEQSHINNAAEGIKDRRQRALDKVTELRKPGSEEVMVVRRFVLLGSKGGGYLLGPRAEMSSWLLSFADVRNSLNDDEKVLKSRASPSRKCDTGSASNGSRRKNKNDKRRRPRHKREERKSVNNADSAADEEPSAPSTEPVLPEGWVEAESNIPDPSRPGKRQSYFYRQGTEEGRSSTWDRPTVPASDWKPEQEPSQDQATKSREGLSANGTNLFRRSMSNAEDEGESATSDSAAAAQAAASSMLETKFPGQKTEGSQKTAFEEASEWANGKSMRDMMCNLHEITAFIPRQLMRPDMHPDPEAELAKVEKAYRKAIRTLHPDRSARKEQYSQYEKWLAAALFSVIKETMSGNQ